MPSFSDYLESIEVLRNSAMRGTERTALETAERASARVADNFQRDLLAYMNARTEDDLRRMQARPPATANQAPDLRRVYDARLDTYLPIPSPYVSGVDWGTPPTPQTRPPAKAPTSTTTIGEPAAIDADYAALVADLGINSAAVDLERFKALVPELGLHVYVDAEVREYLHSLYKVPVGDLTPRVVWGWRPLRPIDRVPGAAAGYNGKVQRGVEPYTKPIPYPVLLTVKAVRDACPSARFYVSDEMSGEAIPDPFLLVEIAGQQFVIERWDEPAFRAKG